MSVQLSREKKLQRQLLSVVVKFCEGYKHTANDPDNKVETFIQFQTLRGIIVPTFIFIRTILEGVNVLPQRDVTDFRPFHSQKSWMDTVAGNITEAYQEIHKT